MDFRDDPADAAFREEVRAWLTTAVADQPTDAPNASFEERLPNFRRWQRKLYDAGYAGMAWPEEAGGRGASLQQQAIFREEADRAGAPDRLNTVGEDFAGPTIVDLGTPEQRSKMLHAILTGEQIWCQLFSEPGAGSDLAALETKAERRGDDWVLNGQKVWTSRAQIADYAICLARTGGGPRHKGITYFLVPMDQPGVVVRPLEHMLGEPEFNEVFLDDAIVPDTLRMGEVDGGWKVAMATLGYERLTLATGRVNVARLVRQLVDEIRDGEDTDGNPLVEDAGVRRKAAALYGRTAIQQINAKRLITKLADGTAGAEASIAKLFTGPLVEDMADFAVDLHGLAGQLDPFVDEDAEAAAWLRLSYQGRGTSIAGGTTFIQRNIVAERVLGLPRG
ncbi:acyl-CoA dehydrogenase family protein [Patulibacter sp. NPDC049589]|uniref:acyl-CoA dehydrogenase family protein n=1 Tax=Patulibacter sp. NPDC049589 TaxID=3154731 RepID=UPI0034173D2D